MSVALPVRLALGAMAPLLLAAAGAPAHNAAPEAAGAHWTAIEFSFKPVGDVAHPWTVHLDASGAGSYAEISDTTPAPMQLAVSATTLERLRRGEHAAQKARCETRQKNIAKTGEKTIQYQSAGGSVGCTFNYSDDVGLMDAAAAFQSIAETMQAGERLQHEERYDRLALDAEMDTLISAIRAGSAIELRNIAPVLQSLVDDDHVIDRVRRKAARLLQDPDSVTAATDDDLSAR